MPESSYKALRRLPRIASNPQRQTVNEYQFPVTRVSKYFTLIGGVLVLLRSHTQKKIGCLCDDIQHLERGLRWGKMRRCSLH